LGLSDEISTWRSGLGRICHESTDEDVNHPPQRHDDGQTDYTPEYLHTGRMTVFVTFPAFDEILNYCIEDIYQSQAN
jgi:hypothetical protein